MSNSTGSLPETIAHGASHDALVGALLASCCEQVLETMFFSPVLDRVQAADSIGCQRLCSHLTFTGRPSGAFEVDADPSAVRAMAADFLGIDQDQVSEQQLAETLSEFTNMVCGSALSSLGNVEYFSLDTPRTALTNSFAPGIEGVHHACMLDAGTIAVCLRVDF